MKILSNELAQHYQISSLQRGHSLFTSFISQNGKILFLDEHIERLLTGATFLFPEESWALNHEKLKQYVETEFKKCDSAIQNAGYFRLSLFDDCIHLQKRELNPSARTLKLTTALKVRTAGIIPSFLKLGNYVEADLELVRAKFKGFDDIVFLDNNQNITEASTSNVFVVMADGEILTPAPSSMILDGVTRKKLFLKLSENHFNIRESVVTKEDLLKAREIWLTNAVRGLRFVDIFEDRKYDISNSIYRKAIDVFGEYGELL